MKGSLVGWTVKGSLVGYDEEGFFGGIGRRKILWWDRTEKGSLVG